ncbi:tetratricopeptide repeat protein [Vogesella fluminis]|uniref:tetratricopeptide repeat protein n=1 Tax=Vogesella fluminis TaxID=1069161 RepID=UPI00362A4A76
MPDQLDALEPAIYVAINSRQWRQLPDFISRYRQLAGHRPALAAMAEGLLAHSQGNYPLALRHMQLASEQEPDDIRIALELARLQFEDNQDSNARKGFARVLEADLPPQAQMQVRQFQQALDARSGWHGSAALGWGYNDNINQGMATTAACSPWRISACSSGRCRKP